MARTTWMRLHRYAGLSIAVFLTMAGLTGSVIAFNHELDEWLNPDLFQAKPAAVALSPLELAAKLEATDPRVRVTYLPLRIEEGRSLSVFVEPRIDPRTQQPFAVDHNQVFLDPASGTTLGTRLWGECCFARQHIIPFLYSLHYTLHLPGMVGVWIMGIIALVWAADSFVGLYLTFPRGQPFFRKWKVAWSVRRDAGSARLNLDLHRAGGLWAWGVLLMLAVSAVSLNLGDQIVRPVVSAFSPLAPDVFHEREEQFGGRVIEPKLLREHMAAAAVAEGKRRGWDLPLDAVYYSSTAGVYGVGLGDHHAPGLGSPYLYFDAADGRLLRANVPGEGSAGDLFMQLQFPLHSGQIAGWPTRILIALTGLVVAMLSITGIVIWARKRRAPAKRRRAPVTVESATHA